MSWLVISIAILIGVFASFAEVAGNDERSLMGITVRWESPDPKSVDSISDEMSRVAKEGGEVYDPDCLYRKLGADGRCHNRFEEKSQALSELSEKFKTETLGFFDIHHRKTTPVKRDFGGVWQGDAIDALKKIVEGPFIVDFAGDIFVSDPRATKREIIITDPVLDKLRYATVEIDRGYILASVSKRLGGKVRVPDAITERPNSGEILKVVLFAHPDFLGARLDAWSTAIVAGGCKVLEHLERLERFQGQWDYFYFEPNGTPHCASSQRIRCDLNGDSRSVRVRYQDEPT